jgi:Na+/proline symporter
LGDQLLAGESRYVRATVEPSGGADRPVERALVRWIVWKLYRNEDVPMHLIDWLIMTVPLIICGGIAVYSRRYVKSVADFMAGGRNAGRFLISTARSEQGAGAVVFVAMFQGFYQSGFGLGWWGNISVPVGLLLMTTGYVIYRYRETRAMTLGQFFEMRYSRRFRLFTGVLGFFAGIVNFGIIPVVGAKCMVYLLELPQTVLLFSHDVPTHLILMAIFLSLCVLTTTTGGQISVLLTDCAEGMFSQLFYTLIGIIVLVGYFKWGATKAMLLDSAPTKSLVNPFDAFGIADFNIWMVLMGIVSGNFYRTIAWQNQHAFNSSAASPHESRMGGVLGRWRGFAVGTMITLLAACAMTYLHDPQGYASVQGVISQIKDPATQDQMRMPTALSQFLPVGVKGMLLSIFVMGIISGDGIHLHSWGSILIQDVIMPFRRKPLTPKQHLTLLRLSIVGVALWAFCFGALFPQTKFIGFWWAITEAIFIGGAGIALVGGLYWSRGTTAGAWAGLFTGSILAVGGILADLYCREGLAAGQEWIVNGVRLSHNHEFIVNGVQVSFFSGISACLCYGLVSMLTCKTPHNMDRLLHRGQYAVETEGPADAPAATGKRVSWVNRIIGIDGQFNRMDRWITHSIFWWSMFWFGVFVVGTAAYLLLRQSGHDKDYNGIWADYSLITGIYLPLAIGAVTTIWFTIGCWHDMREFFKRLREEKTDAHDDGTVQHEDHDSASLQAEPESSGAPSK